MPKIIVKQPFKFAHFGYQVEEFEVSDQPRDTTVECAEIALREGWVVGADELKSRAESAAAEQPDLLQQRHTAAAPENKDAAPQRRTKASA